MGKVLFHVWPPQLTLRVSAPQAVASGVQVKRTFHKLREPVREHTGSAGPVSVTLVLGSTEGAWEPRQPRLFLGLRATAQASPVCSTLSA